MKVLTCCASISRIGGGVTTAMRELCHSLNSETGVDVRVVSLADDFSEDDISSWTPLTPELVVTRGPRVLGYAPKMVEYLLRSDADIVHSHAMWQHPCAAVNDWQAITSKPYVVTAHGMLHTIPLRRARIKKRVAMLLYAGRHFRCANAWHALNEAECRAMRAFGLKNPIAIIPFGTHLPEEAEIDCHTRPARLLFLGRLHALKGLRNLVTAWSQLPRQNRVDWRLIIAGWDDSTCESQLKGQATALGIEDTIEFVGPKFGHDKAELLRGSQAFILPSFSEGLPMAVLEAWSYGLPVVMTDQCNLPEGFAHQAALRIETAPESIAAGLRTLMSMSPTELRSMGARGRSLVEKKFAWPEIAQQMAGVYRWVLGGGSPPACVETA